MEEVVIKIPKNSVALRCMYDNALSDGKPFEKQFDKVTHSVNEIEDEGCYIVSSKSNDMEQAQDKFIEYGIDNFGTGIKRGFANYTKEDGWNCVFPVEKNDFSNIWVVEQI